MILTLLLNSTDKSFLQSLVYYKKTFMYGLTLNHDSLRATPQINIVSSAISSIFVKNQLLLDPTTTPSLRRLKDELHALTEPSSYTCTARKMTKKKKQLNKFFNSKSHVLALNPLSTVTKAYATIHIDET